MVNTSSAKFSNRDEELILARVLNKPRSFILAHPEYKLNKKERNSFNKLARRRLRGEPLAYVLGEQEFYGLLFKVNKHVLIPRPETEMMVDEITASAPLLASPLSRGRKFSPPLTKGRVREGSRNDIMVDVGTGSGVLAISIAKKIPNSKFQIPKIFATDISNKALTVAKQNAKLNQVDKQITFLRGNLLEPILKNSKNQNLFKIQNSLAASRVRGQAKFKILIVANLPYLKNSLPGLTKSQKRDLGFEPKTALLAGADGLKYYRQLAKQIKQLRATYPRLNLTLYLEADPDQMSKLKKIFPAFKAKIIKDFCGRNRFLILH